MPDQDQRLVGSLAWLIGRSVSRPIGQMTLRMQSLAAGELDQVGEREVL